MLGARQLNDPTPGRSAAPTSTAFGVLPTQPFAVQQQQAAGRVQRAADRLPSRPALLRAPAVAMSRGQAQRFAAAQGRRIQQAIKAEGHGVAYGRELAATPPADRGQVPTAFERLYRASNAQDRAELHRFAVLNEALNVPRPAPTWAGVTRAAVSEAPLMHVGGESPAGLLEQVGRLVRARQDRLQPFGPDPQQTVRTAQDVVQQKPGWDPSALAGQGQGDNPLAALLGNFARSGAAIGDLTHIHGGGVLGNVVNDAIDFSAQLLPSVAASINDPVGTAGGLLQMVEDPLKTLHDHPLFAAALLHGGVSGAGRLAGAGARAGLLGGRAAAFADQTRLPLTLLPATEGRGLPVEVPRRYSPDITRLAAQKLGNELRRQVLLQDPNVATGARLAKHLVGGSELLHAVRLRNSRGTEAARALVRPGLVDFFRGEVERQRRTAAGQAIAFVDALAKHLKAHGEAGGHAVSLAMEGALRTPATLPGDLAAEARALDFAATHGEINPKTGVRHPLTGVELENNRHNRAMVEELRNNPEFLANPHEHFAAAGELAGLHNQLEAEYTRLGGMLSEQQRAKYFPVAQRHGGAVTSVEAARRVTIAKAEAKRAGDLLRTIHGRLKDRYGGLKQALLKTHPDQGGDPAEFAQVMQAKMAAERAAGDLHAAREMGRVWGRYHLEDVHAVEQARAAASVTGAEVTRTKKVYDSAVKAEGRMVGRHQVKRGQAQVRARGGRVGGELQGKVQGETGRVRQRRAMTGELKAKQDAYGRAQEAHAEKRAAVGEAVARRNAREISGLRKETGQPWTTPELHDLSMRETAGRGVGFLGHETTRDYRASVRSRLQRAGIERFRRTGESFAQGSYLRGWEALRHQAYDTINAISSHRAMNAAAERFGVGSFADPREADRMRESLERNPDGSKNKAVPGGWEVVRIGPEQTLGMADMRGADASLMHSLGGASETLGAAKYTVVPKIVMDRFAAHDAIANRGVGKELLRTFTSKWRATSLFTSPRWLVGNPQEFAIRLAIENISPSALFGAGRDGRVMRVALDELSKVIEDPNATEMQKHVARSHIAAAQFGAHYGSVSLNQIRSQVLPWAHETAGVKTVVGAWDRWRDQATRFQSAAERNAAQATMGRLARRELGHAIRGWGKLTGEQDRIVREWARGKLDPNEAAAFGAKVIESMGNWTMLTPALRAATQVFTPFGLWWVNSLKFVYKTLPAKHPFKTAIIAALEQATAKSRPGQQAPWETGSFGANLPLVGNVNVGQQYYSPFGIGIEPLKTAGDMFLPQLAQPWAGTFGTDPFTEQQLSGPGGGKLDIGQSALRILSETLSGVTPGARQLQQLLQRGGKPYATANLLTDLLHEAGAGPSQVKPGTQRDLEQTLIKIFSPLRYTYAHGNQAGRGGSTGGGLWRPPVSAGEAADPWAVVGR